MTIHQNIFRQVFEESLSVKISPHQNFALYGICFSMQLATELLLYAMTIILCDLTVTLSAYSSLRPYQINFMFHGSSRVPFSKSQIKV